MTELTKAPAAAVQWTCSCGNNSSLEGCYRCDPDGHPLPGAKLRCCDRCGRITDVETGEYAGRRSFALPQIDEYEAANR